jgi:polyferredoxin
MLGARSLSLVVVAGCIAFFAAGVAIGDARITSYPGFLLAAAIVILPIHVVGQFRQETDRAWLPKLSGGRANHLKLAAFGAVWLIAIWIMPFTGFIVAMTLGVCASLTALGIHRLYLTVPVVSVVVVAIFALIERVLYVPMPRGPLEDAIGGLFYRMAQGS